jgi:hypothetical protein
MCGGPLGGMLSLVSSSTVHIAIDAHVADDGISGQIRSDAGPPGAFSGWLGLIGALDAVLSQGTGANSAGSVREESARPRPEP